MSVADLVICSSQNRGLTETDLFWQESGALRTLSKMLEDPPESLTTVQKSSILYLHSVAPFVQGDATVGCTLVCLSLLEIESLSDWGPLHQLNATFLQQSVPYITTKAPSIMDFCQAVLDAWISITSDLDGLDRACESLVFQLEQVMCKVLTETTGPLSGLMCELFSEHSRELVVGRILLSKHWLESVYHNEPSVCLLSSLLECDWLLYAPEFLSLLSSSSSLEVLPGLVRKGLLDAALGQAFRYLNVEESNPQARAAVVPILVKRVIALLETIHETSVEELYTIGGLLERLKKEISADHNDQIAVAVMKWTEHGPQNPVFRSLDATMQRGFLEFTLTFCSGRASNCSGKIVELSGSVLGFLLHLLPERLGLATSGLDGGLGNPSTILTGIQELLQSQEGLKSFAMQPVETLIRAFQACIDFGLKASKPVTLKQHEQALSFVRFVVERLSTGSSLNAQVATCKTVLLSQILDSLSSHCRLEDVLQTPENGAEFTIKINLLETVLVCLSDLENHAFNERLWTSLLVDGFHAGVTYSDTLIRQTLSTYSKQAPMVSSPSFILPGILIFHLTYTLRFSF
jgi:hypothetical protein